MKSRPVKPNHPWRRLNTIAVIEAEKKIMAGAGFKPRQPRRKQAKRRS